MSDIMVNIDNFQLAIMADEEREEKEEEEREEGEDSHSLRGTEGSTPECASPGTTKPVIEHLQRTASAKPKVRDTPGAANLAPQGSPTLAPKRTDSSAR